MSINIEERQLPHQYEKYAVNKEKFKQGLQQADKDSVIARGNDMVNISKAGRNALENKLSSLSRAGQNTDVRKLSPVSSFSIMNYFERAVSAEKKEGVRSNTFDQHVNQMVSAYKLMKDSIEEKYTDIDREQQYYVADDGSIQELTKEKELEMLDKAYEEHSEFMASSTEIWSNLQDFKPEIIYQSKENVREGLFSAEAAKKGEIKNEAYKAFMSAINNENQRLISRKKNGFILNLDILTSSRNKLNSIWDYYANLK